MTKANKTVIPIELSLKDYVNSLDDSRKTQREMFREQLAERLHCSVITIRQKLAQNRWTLLEKHLIAEMLETDIETLFPES